MAVLSNQDVRASATVNMPNANGTTMITGSINWTPPPAPVSVATLESVRFVCDLYSWTGKGTFTITVNGRQWTPGSSIDVALPLNTAPPYSITGVGGNKNATGTGYSFTNPVIIYTYSIEGGEELQLKVDGVWGTVRAVYKKINGAWAEQNDLAALFDENMNYVHVIETSAILDRDKLGQMILGRGE